MTFLHKMVIKLLLIMPLAFSSFLYASTETGLVWLSSQVSSDNNYSVNTKIATPFQSLSELHTTLKANTQTVPPEVLLQINADNYNGTEYLSRKIIANLQSGNEVSSFVTELFRHQNVLKSFGEQSAYNGSVIDTAFALNALAGAGISGQNVNYAMSFLLENQQADGSWKDGQNTSSVYVTSLVLRALWNFQHTYNIKANLDKAQTYLISKKNGGNWGETYLTSHVLFSLLPMVSDKTLLVSAIDSLRASQMANGSWEDDIFVTALALQAIELSERPVTNAYLASLKGVILDGDTQKALSGVTLTLAGQSINSKTDGSFLFSSLDTGTYMLEVIKPEYGKLVGEITLNVGQNLNLGTIKLLKQVTGATSGTIRGTISDASGSTLAGVSVTAGALSTVTANDGSFQISNVPTGEVTVIASINGYFSVSTKINVEAGGIVLFSPAMKLVNTAPNTSPASIIGTIVDFDTKEVLIGVTVALDNGINRVTSADGSFSFNDVTPGSYTVTFSKTGYAALSGIISIAGGQISNFGTLELSKVSATATTGRLSGVIIDKETHAPLSGVSVFVGTLSTLTDVNGKYLLDNIVPGPISIITDTANYYPASGTAEITAGASILFSPQLQMIPESFLFGKVTDADTSAILPGAVISVSGAAILTTTTSATGEYLLKLLKEGTISIQVSKDGYDTLTISANVSKGNQISFSPTLHAVGTSPENANTSSLVGQVLNSRTNEIMANVTVNVTEEGNLRSLATDNDGKFIVEGIKTAEVNLEFVAAGFRPVSFVMPIEPLKNLDLGQVRLRPAELEKIQPDLVIAEVNASAVSTNPASLSVEGFIEVKPRNIGNSDTTQPINILAYHDANNNSSYDEGIDALLGQTLIVNGLKVDENQTAQIEISGTLPFRDAPITVWIDSSKMVLELDENNNIYISSQACRLEIIPAGELDPVVKWHWDAKDSIYSPDFKDPYSSPIVVRIQDDNNDSVINEFDTPAIVFHTHRRNQTAAGSILRAVDGKDGHELWSVNNILLQYSTDIAAADIDNDGVVEIIAVTNGSYLCAFEHNGILKWKSKEPLDLLNSSISVNDLDHDGLAEIIYGNIVFNNNGQILWKGIAKRGLNNFSSHATSIVADINMDGFSEIIAGSSAYNYKGDLLWNLKIGDGYTAIGNFNSDKYPEIVLVTAGKVYLLSHEGEIIWGPVNIPGGGGPGGGGAPTVADLDGDGELEIGIAGANYYVVFETDGSVKWNSRTRDYSSAITGSSAFDFNGDKKVEIIYADEMALRIYDGQTSQILYSLANSSGTAKELPVIADIDNDGHADIVFIGNEYGVSPYTPGIRALTGRNDNWMPTRSIWNQHSYHITNINDDGTIPINEKPSWLTHNSYRLNTFADHGALEAPDLSASLLRLIDNGTTNPYTLKIRIGNGGIIASPATTVNFYNGDPKTGGTLIGTQTVPALESNHYADIELPNVTNLSGTDIYAVVDPDTKISECNEVNNIVNIPFATSNTLGSISASISDINLSSNSLTILGASVINEGTLPTSFNVELVLKDSSGNHVVKFPQQNTGTFDANATVQISENWNTGTTIAGTYLLEAILRDGIGNIIDNDTQELTISIGTEMSDGTTLTAALRTTTDKPIYHTTDTLVINNLVQNLAVNNVIEDAVLKIDLFDTNGTHSYTQNITLGSLLPSAMRQSPLTLPLIAAAEGIYMINGTLLDKSGAQLASSSSTYEVAEDTRSALLSNVTVESKILERGETQICNATLYHNGRVNLSALHVRQTIVFTVTEAEVSDQIVMMDLAAYESHDLSYTLSTLPMQEGEYFCILQAQINGVWETLAHDAFVVTEPPVKLDVNIMKGVKGRLLILLDQTACKHDDGYESTHKDKHRDKDDEHTSEYASKSEHQHELNDLKNLASLSAQRAYLEALLRANGYAYSIVTKAEDFEKEFRSGKYSAYLLMNKVPKLSEQVQREMAEASFRGEGLLISGKHDQRNGRLDEIAGASYKGKSDYPTSMDMNGTIYRLELNDDKLHIEAEKSEVLARFKDSKDTEHACKKQYGGKEFSSEKMDTEESEESHKHENFDEHQDKHKNEDEKNAAITFKQAYKGKAVFIAFDLLRYSTELGGEYETLFLDLLARIQNEIDNAIVSSILPVTLEVKNLGVPVKGEGLTYHYNTDAYIIDPGEATLKNDGSLHWNYSLLGSNTTTLSFWVWPKETGMLELESSIYYEKSDSSILYDVFTHGFEITKRPHLSDIIVSMELDGDSTYKKALKYLKKAQKALESNNLNQALDFALKAADSLEESDKADELHYALALAIKTLSMQYGEIKKEEKK